MSKPRHPATPFPVTAQRLSADGHGIAFAPADVREYWIPNLLPDESALIEVVHNSPHRAQSWGRIVERTSPECAERVQPPCPAFGVCGGCCWQHLSPSGQAEQKHRCVQAALEAALPHTAIPDFDAPAVGEAAGYRNKGKYVFSRDGDAVTLGAYKPRSHDVVSTLGCCVVEPAIDRIAQRLADLCSEVGAPVFREGAEAASGLRYAVVRANAEGETLIVLVSSSDTEASALAVLADRLLAAEPLIVGVIRCDNDSTGGVLLTPALRTLKGASTLSESTSGASIALGAGAFWQLNRTVAENAFRDLASGLALEQGARVVELYSGVGAISLALAREGYDVFGVESNSEAVATATVAAAAAGLSARLRFEVADATNLPPSSFEGAAAIVVDPPRKGLGKAGREQLLAAHPPAIAYLSCGPESFAKDLALLVLSGYRIESIKLYDFMPGTAQVESLAILRRT